MPISTLTRDGLLHVILANDRVAAEIIPERGGRMVSLIRRASGHQFLLPPPEPARAARPAAYGASFEEHHTSGFDECLPSVKACRVAAAHGAGVAIPDHGEVWAVPCAWDLEDDALVLESRCRALPLTLRKRIAVDGHSVVAEYALTNRGAHSTPFLWSAHPLLAARPGDRIVLPEDVRALTVEWSLGDRLGGHGDTADWPLARTRDAARDDLRVIKPRSVGWADKLFTPRLSVGYCALQSPAADEAIAFHFDCRAVPFAGIWICQGGWPAGRPGHFTVALEPTTARCDGLAECVERGEAPALAAGATREWSMRIEIASGGTIIQRVGRGRVNRALRGVCARRIPGRRG